MENFKCGKLYDLELSKLTPNPDQPRKVFSDPEIQALADSIKEKGLLQPILVKKVENGQIIIVSGERRFRAHQLLERDTIPAWFTTGDPEELALVENLVREDLSAVETAEALDRLRDKLEGQSQADLAKLIGKAESTVSEILSLNKLPQHIRDEIRGDKRYPLRKLKLIAKMKNPQKQIEVFRKLKQSVTNNPTKSRLTGLEAMKKRIREMTNYFPEIKDDKLIMMIEAKDEIMQLSNRVSEIINRIESLDMKFDASNAEEATAKYKKNKK